MFDRSAALCLLVVLAPVLAVCALVVGIADREAPVVTTSPRVGRGGRIFGLRTFASPHTPALSWAFEGFGLRHLPELINVIRGDMSLVGPRPQIPRTPALHATVPADSSVRPGMTGLWFLADSQELTPDELDELARDYAESWSIATDIRILTKSAAAVRYRPKND